MTEPLSETDWQAQVTDFRRLTREQPDNGDLWLRYAQFLERACDNPQLVVLAYENAQRLLPHIDCRPNLGSALVTAGRIDEGLAMLRAVVQVKATAPRYCSLGFALLQSNQFPAARVAFEKAILLEGTYEEAYYLLGEATRFDPELAPWIKLKQAVAAYEAALRLDNNYQLAWQALGLILTKQHESLDSGITALKRAIELKPTDGWSLIFLAAAYWKRGDIALADRTYLEAISACPNTTIFEQSYNEFLEATSTE